MYNYQQLINEFSIKSIEDLKKVFWEEIAQDWNNAYQKMSIHGSVTLQNFCGYAFIIDDGNQVRGDSQAAETEILESRVVGAFGVSSHNKMNRNRQIMRAWLGKTSDAFNNYGSFYDKGHFLAHAIGGPIDVNLFPQRRDINRGWSAEGKEFRKMEKFVAANPGIFVFCRPIYTDISFCPTKIEFGYCDEFLQFNVKQFPNR